MIILLRPVLATGIVDFVLKTHALSLARFSRAIILKLLNISIFRTLQTHSFKLFIFFVNKIVLLVSKTL